MPRSVRLAALLGVAILAPFAAHAQVPAAPGTIEQVVVTAQHKRELARKVPIAISTIAPARVAELVSDGEDIRALSAQAPSLYIESSFGRTYPRFYIRGLGNSDFTYNAQQPVSVVYDDVVEENPVLKAFPIFDIADVEVLRGPQGTLFGRNTPAGVVKIDSILPSDEYHGYGTINWGTYNTVNVTAGLGGAIVPGVLDFRVAVQEQRRDNWVTNIDPTTPYGKHLEGYSDFAGKGTLLYKPTADLNILLAADGRDLDGTARLFRADILAMGSNRLVPGFDVNEVNLDGDNAQTEKQEATHLTINDTLGAIKLTSITAYEHATTFSRGDIDGGNTTSLPISTQSPGPIDYADETSDAIPDLDQFSQEFRVATTGDGKFFNQAGLYFFYEHLAVDSLDYFDGAPDISLSQDQKTTSISAFDSATYKILPDLTAGAGIRVTHDHKSYTVACQYGCVAPLVPTVDTSHTAPTFNVDLNYAATPDANVYGRIATGYLGPAIDGRNVEYDFGDTTLATLTQAKAETTTSYEVGMKATLLDHRANFDLALYHADTDNLQLTAVGGVANTTVLLNAKNAVADGVEANLDIRPIDNVLISVGGSYNFTKIEDPNLELPGCGTNFATGTPFCTVKDPKDPVTGNYHIDGNPLPNAPRFVIDWRGRYTLPITGDIDVYLATDWSYRSSVDYFLYQATEFKSQSLLLGGARIGFVDHRNGVEIAGFVRNVLDQVRVTGAIDFDNLTGFVNDPRTLGIEASVKF